MKGSPVSSNFAPAISALPQVYRLCIPEEYIRRCYPEELAETETVPAPEESSR